MSLKTLSVVVLLLPLLGCGSSRMSTAQHEASTARVQLRWAETSPGEGLTEKTVLGRAEKLYLHKTVLLTESDIATASPLLAADGPAFLVKFTAQGREKIAALTSKNTGRRLAIVVDGVVVSAPKISGPIPGEAVIAGGFSMAEAERIARQIRGEKVDSETPLAAELVTAWTGAGAEVGWTRYGITDFYTDSEGKKGDVPGFRFAEWTDGVVGKLPQPERAFGLVLFGTKVTDAGLKELARLQGMQVLDLSFTTLTDAGLKELGGLNRLQVVSLSYTKVTDAGLKELAALKDLEALLLDGTHISDTGLRELAGLKGLQCLNLNYTQVTDAGLEELTRLKGLQKLALGGTKLTDTGLKVVVKLQSLQSLSLGFTQVTNAGLKHLAELKNLQQLALIGTHVTDAGLKELGVLKGLQSLTLGRTEVTDAGLKHLAGLKSLRWLNLAGTQVTDAGVAELQKALPTVKILGR